MSDTKAFPSSESVASELLKNGSLSDITLVCSDGREFHAHTFAHYISSAYFRKALTHDWKETKTGRFELADNSSTIQAMLDFMYTKEYSLTTLITGADRFSELLQLHVNVCIAADYYGVVGLADYAEKRFHNAVNDWQKMKKALPDVVRAIYANDCKAVEGIRNEVLKVTLASMAELELNQGYLKLFDEVGAFTRQLFFKSRTEKPLSTYGILKTECHFCRKTIEIVIKESSENIHCPLCGADNFASGLRRRKRH